MALIRRQGGAPGGLPWKIRTKDLGLRLVDEIGHSLTLDEEWCVKTVRGFEWWGKDLRQRVWAEPALDDNGFQIFRLHAQTDLLRDFPPGEKALEALNVFARFATTSGYLVDEKAGTVRLVASMYVHEQTARWVKPAFQLVVAMQAADAQIKAEVVAELTGSAAAVSPHPTSGARPDFDDMLNVLEQFIAPAGQGPSAWIGEDMKRAWHAVRGAPWCVLSLGEDTGFSAEFPFQSRTSLLQVKTTEQNPQLGNGVLLLLCLPMNIAQGNGHAFAAKLMREELAATTRAHLLGSWCWAETGLVHTTFLPNAWHLDGADLTNVAFSMGMRARWVAETFYGDSWERNRDAEGRPLATPAALENLDLLERLWGRGGRRSG